ncbi:MaoC family dehydratase [Antrihabitans sp. YC2-6]|uniref:MaoC family dehydratase n=1 Tax=Antrihabitans sp. YC2-6 TaxID=2799498 RepID=UPI0018F2E293|nr:MaoC family dehydratase [Antrihabitans sp. YC2-6]MBJ8348423.1 MaoC family dehydratase [Antrihabitans sp. YC2-6]
MKTFSSIAEFAAAEGTDLGTTEWLTVDQKRIDTFAEATGDHQWIHVDPEKAAAGPFGTTIAHGLLTLSLLPIFVHQLYSVDGVAMAINYGLNKVRFITPVPAGSRLRASAIVGPVAQVSGGVQAQINVTIELEGAAKPACIAESIVRLIG